MPLSTAQEPMQSYLVCLSLPLLVRPVLSPAAPALQPIHSPPYLLARLLAERGAAGGDPEGAGERGGGHGPHVAGKPKAARGGRQHIDRMLLCRLQGHCGMTMRC